MDCDKCRGRVRFPNMLITARQAFFTEETLSEIATVTLQNISDFDAGHFLKPEVNLE